MATSVSSTSPSNTLAINPSKLDIDPPAFHCFLNKHALRIHGPKMYAAWVVHLKLPMQAVPGVNAPTRVTPSKSIGTMNPLQCRYEACPWRLPWHVKES